MSRSELLQGSLGVKTNRETWIQTVKVVDENDVAIDISAATITVSVEATGTTTAKFSATVGSGITVASPNFTWTFSVANMRTLCPGIHKVGCTIVISGITYSLIVGTVTVIDGIVD